MKQTIFVILLRDTHPTDEETWERVFTIQKVKNFPRIFKYFMIRYLDNEAFLDISLFLEK